MNNENTKKSLKIFAYIGIFLIVVCAIFTGVRLGQMYLSERDGDIGIASAEISSSITQYLDGPIVGNIGGMSSTSGAGNNQWQNLSVLNTSGNYDFYKIRFVFIVNPNGSGGYSGEFYVSAYNNSVEWLNGYVVNDRATFDNYTYAKLNSCGWNPNSGTFNRDGYYSATGLKSQKNAWYTTFASIVTFGRDSNNNLVAPSFSWVAREVGNYTSSINPFTNSFSTLNNTGYYNWIRWTDSTGFTFAVAIPVYYSANGYSVRPMWYYDYAKTYYYDGSTTDLNNTYYQQGYDAGYNEGSSVNYNNGYDAGYNAGYGVGDQAGYNRGLTDGGNYTFLGLMGAVVDAPISAFQSMFNFELLGINLTAFLEALFSICIVITIVKFVLVK